MIGIYGITQELVDKLDALYPDKLPKDSITIEELTYLQGQRVVIDQIKQLFIESTQEGEVKTLFS